MEVKNTLPGSSFIESWVKNIFSRTIKVSGKAPKHVGFIMDGNRRFAKKNEIEVKEGHEAGFFSMSKILELLYESGVEVATVYAFSIENFKRSSKEIDNLMELAKDRIKQISEHGELAQKYGIKIKVIGDLSLLKPDVYKEMQLAMKTTENNTRAILNICFPYTGREEILHSMKTVIENTKDENEITEELIEKNLYTGDQPPLDLLIRTSGVHRLSDFMIWQASNKGVVIELLDCLWPEFTPFKMAWILLKFIFKNTFFNINDELEDKKLQ